MSTKNIIVVLALVIVVGGGLLYYQQVQAPRATPEGVVTQPPVRPPVQQPTAPAVTNATTSVMKFKDQPYVQFAYEVDPNGLNALSPTLKLALSGFTLTAKKETNGSTVVSFKSINTEYHDQQYTLRPGDKLYFIEKNLKDDQDGQEKYLQDDTAVVVDKDGNIVQ